MQRPTNCLISAGPTREWLDPVRFISNPSSGKMGYALAEAAIEFGMKVTLVTGPVSLKEPSRAKIIRVDTALEMHDAMHREFTSSNLIIMAAAVCDHRPIEVFDQKVKKGKFGKCVTLIDNPDIVMSLGKIKSPLQKLVGFAAETENHFNNAKEKIILKNLDWIAMNDVSRPGNGFESDYNAVSMISRFGERRDFKLQKKLPLARSILELVSA